MIQRNNTSEKLHNSNIIGTVWLILKSNKQTIFNSWIMQVCNDLTNKPKKKTLSLLYMVDYRVGTRSQTEWNNKEILPVISYFFHEKEKKLKWQDVSGFLFWMLVQDTYYAVMSGVR